MRYGIIIVRKVIIPFFSFAHDPKEQMCATTIPTIWNKEVPSGIKHFQEATFLSAYKDHFLQQYKAFTCTKSNCYSCNH